MSRYFSGILQEQVLRFSITWRVLTENFQYVIVASTKSLHEEKSLLHEGKAVCMTNVGYISCRCGLWKLYESGGTIIYFTDSNYEADEFVRKFRIISCI